jgi:predicted nucleic acid-binding protein
LYVYALRNSKALGATEKISKLTESQLEISYTQVISKIKFINEEIIPEEIWLNAAEITNGVDIDDTDFIALTKFLKATLWTVDKALYNGLKKKKFKKLLNTTELLALRTAKSEK